MNLLACLNIPKNDGSITTSTKDVFLLRTRTEGLDKRTQNERTTFKEEEEEEKKKIYCMSQTDGSNIERLREMVHKDLLITITGDDAAVLIDLMYSLEANNKPHTISVIIVAVCPKRNFFLLNSGHLAPMRDPVLSA